MRNSSILLNGAISTPSNILLPGDIVLKDKAIGLKGHFLVFSYLMENHMHIFREMEKTNVTDTKKYLLFAFPITYNSV